MTLTIRYFAALRETLGCAVETLDSEAATLGQLRDELIARSPLHAQALNRSRLLRVAQNQALCDESQALLPGAEVAFFPPVTGG